jgi:antitoxin VapB
MAEIRRRWSEMRVLDNRTPEEILGYDAHGLPR